MNPSLAGSVPATPGLANKLPSPDKTSSPPNGERLPAPALVEELKTLYNRRAGVVRNADGSVDPTLVHIEKLPARDAVFGELSRPLPPLLQRALDRRGIENLYSHQVHTIEALREGKNVALVTATASGKTLSFNLPVLETLLKNPSATALYIFPTNALMNDQLNTLNGLLADLEGGAKLKAFRYNGAMSSDEKQAARRARPNILLTNPEMVHLSLTGWHKIWGDYLRNLRYIVIDEVHTYRGVFGSHIAHLLRRLRRVCAYYGANPQFVCCSATIGNPLELVQNLTGLNDFEPVTEDGSRRNERHFVIWKPPTFSPDEGRAEPVTRPYLEETVDLFRHLLNFKYSTLCFSRLRRYAESMYRMSRDHMTTAQSERIMVYRAGLRADERVSIEKGLKGGDLDGVFSTNALELGIDIGGLDAVIIAGYPGSQMAVWQQAGRAGRGDKDAAVFLVASQNPIDQYFVANPTDLFQRQPESALLSVENENIARQHLLCMAQELPFDRANLLQYYPPSVAKLVEKLITEKTLASKGRGVCYYPGAESPHGRVSLRSSTSVRYTIVNHSTGKEIGVIEPPNLYLETHPGAIYTHAGETYRVEKIDETAKQVIALPVATNHFTTAVARTQILTGEGKEVRKLKLKGGFIETGFGSGEVIEQIYGYREAPLYMRTRRPPDVVNLDRPLTVELKTDLVWLVLPPREEFGYIAAFDSGLHGLEHLLSALFPLQVMCDPTDIGSSSSGASIFHGQRPVIYLFDNFEGGAGFAHGCFDRLEELLRLALRTVRSCKCKSGCPACVQSARCREASDKVSKEGTRLILQHLLG
jgi:DEAD/DEAH box helicase domain-containing protein